MVSPFRHEMGWRMTIGKRIKAAMRNADGGEGINQSELARRLGIAPQAVQSWVRDKDPVVPRQSRIASIARVLGVTENYLYGTEIEPRQEQLEESGPQLLQRIMGAAPKLTPKEMAVLRAFVDALIVMQGGNEAGKGKETK